MARPLRIQYPGAVYHVTSRGNEKKRIFRDDTDREIFLEILFDINKRCHWICHAYCLMDNHYHLMIETPDGNLSAGMRQLNGVYTQAYNKKRNRSGHLLQGRYKAIVIQKDSHLLEACRYVVLNPVRARIVEQPENWKWSSYLETAGKKKPYPCLTTDWILGQFSKTRATAEKEYCEFVKSGLEEETIWASVKGQVILGEEEFVDSLNHHLKKHKNIAEISKTQRYANRPSLDSIFAKNILRDKSQRDNKIITAIYDFGYTQRAIANYLGLHFTYISRIVREHTKR